MEPVPRPTPRRRLQAFVAPQGSRTRRPAQRLPAAESSSSSAAVAAPAVASAGASGFSMASLPSDMLAAILERCSPREGARLMRVSWGMRAAAGDAALWRRHCLDLWPEDDFASGPPSPGRYGVRVNLLRGCTLCSTRLDRSRRDSARALVLSLGGEWDDSLTTGTTHLVCGAGYTPKAIRAHRARIPAVTPDWLTACVREAKRPCPAAFRVPPLAGATLTTSGLSPADREAVRRRVVALGGSFDCALRASGPGRPGTTHLLALSARLCGPDKLRAALRWAIPVVHPRWLEALEGGGPCVEPDRFRLLSTWLPTSLSTGTASG